MRITLPLRAATGLVGLGLLSHGAAAQFGPEPFTNGGVLPTVGTNSANSDLRLQLEPYFSPPAPLSRQPALIISPSLGVDLGVTDNARRVASPRQADVFTLISPSIALSADTSRLRVNLNYSPTISIYANQSSQNQIVQSGAGQALATIVPNAVFLDVRGSITEESLTGNGINSTVTSYNAQNAVQTITVSITPYAEHRFGGYGTARVGYSFARTLQDQVNGNNTLQQNNFNNTFNPALVGTPAYGAIGNLTTQRERASFVTGEDLGRINDSVVAEAFQYSGGGTSYTGAYRNQVSNEFGYAVTRIITALAGIGYQNIRYGGNPNIRIDEPSYNFGGRYTPNPDTTVTVLYGRRDAISSISFDGTAAPTARTRLIGRYSTGLTTDIEEAQNVLSTTSVGPTGLLTDTATGAPVGSGSSFGVQNGVYKLRRLSATGLLLQDRDSYSVGIVMEDRTTITNTPSILGGIVIPAGTGSNSFYVNASWQHDLAPDLSTVLSGQYGTTNNTSQFVTGQGGNQRTLSITGALNKQFTETLSGSVRYTFTNQSSTSSTAFNQLNARAGLNTGSYTENVLLVGLRKSF